MHLKVIKKRGGTGAVLGAGAGALTPAALRMAGAGLAGIPALAGLVQKGAMGARAAAGLQGPVMSGANILKQGALPLGMALNAPAIAGGLVAGGSGAANTLVKLALVLRGVLLTIPALQIMAAQDFPRALVNTDQLHLMAV